jgi:hypothetical protein
MGKLPELALVDDDAVATRGKKPAVPAHDPYGGLTTAPSPQAVRTDLRELSRLIQLRREKEKKKSKR